MLSCLCQLACTAAVPRHAPPQAGSAPCWSPWRARAALPVAPLLPQCVLRRRGVGEPASMYVCERQVWAHECSSQWQHCLCNAATPQAVLRKLRTTKKLGITTCATILSASDSFEGVRVKYGKRPLPNTPHTPRQSNQASAASPAWATIHINLNRKIHASV